MACDICGKTGTRLNDLLSCYRSPGIVDICDSCESAVNKRLWVLRGITQRWIERKLRQHMQRRAGKLTRPRNWVLPGIAVGGFVALVLLYILYVL